MMELKLLRFNNSSDSTNGILFDITNEPKFLCYTLEDEPRKVKVNGETCIPVGIYDLGFRKVGRLNDKYAFRFPELHVGMIEIQDVPNFKYILIHCGNTDEDTSGCLLLGDTQENNNIRENGFVGKSTQAYFRIYKYISDALSSGEECTIMITDFIYK
ncbi:MAG: hypothetical protein Unbinned2250contig1000_30 [Prokaryotic dsDNA virus sp.]|nr:MAG: hypothetical protein Unbinned2250contig1000_30 [Prokaryotic dsDNA virus sp.]